MTGAFLYWMPVMNKTRNTEYCKMHYRLAAILYDAILLGAVYFFSTLIILPFMHGQAISPGNLPYIIYLYSITFLYFTWQWSQGGQTLGMRAWNLRLVSSTGFKVTFSRAAIRFLAATLSLAFAGTGFLWASVDRDGLTLHDRLSGTSLIKTG